MNLVDIVFFDGPYKILHVVWFDDGDMSLEESLYNILPEIDWDKDGQEFEY